MLDGVRISDELWEMAAEKADAVVHRAVQRIYEAGSPYDWVGIYLVAGDQLVLHSYIGGPTELSRVPVGEGMRGAAVAEMRNINVSDVSLSADHQPRSVETRSEAVALIRDGERVLGLVDVDSTQVEAFGEADVQSLSLIAETLGAVLGSRVQE